MINTDFIRKHPAQTVLTVLGLSGVVLIFLPFLGSEVPGEVFLDGLDELGLLTLLGPCVVLPFLISAGYLRWLLTGGLSRWESGLGYALALIVVVLLSLSIIQGWWESDFTAGLVYAFLALGLAAGTWFIIQHLRHGPPLALTALVAMQLAYLPFALGWLVADDFGLIVYMSMGAYLALVTVIVYTAQAALSVRGQPRLLLRLLPLGVVWVAGLAAGFAFEL